MPTLTTLSAFIVLVFGMSLIPGPNMVYLISRSICQGRLAGFISLGGVTLGFAAYMICTILGITAIFLAVPYAYDTLRLLGAAYLLYLAWEAVRPGGRLPFATLDLSPDSARRLFIVGFATNLLNPKVAIFYLSLLPQFIRSRSGEHAQAIFCPRGHPDPRCRYRGCIYHSRRRINFRGARTSPRLDQYTALDHGHSPCRDCCPNGKREPPLRIPLLANEQLAAQQKLTPIAA